MNFICMKPDFDLVLTVLFLNGKKFFVFMCELFYVFFLNGMQSEFLYCIWYEIIYTMYTI